MPLPSVTPAQYRALQTVERTGYAIALGPDGSPTFWKPRGVSKPTVAKLVELGLIGVGVALRDMRGVHAAELTNLGQQVLDAKRGEGDRGND